MIYKELKSPIIIDKHDDKYKLIGYYHRGDNIPTVYEAEFESIFGIRYCQFSALEINIELNKELS